MGQTSAYVVRTACDGLVLILAAMLCAVQNVLCRKLGSTWNRGTSRACSSRVSVQAGKRAIRSGNSLIQNYCTTALWSRNRKPWLAAALSPNCHCGWTLVPLWIGKLGTAN